MIIHNQWAYNTEVLNLKHKHINITAERMSGSVGVFQRKVSYNILKCV